MVENKKHIMRMKLILSGIGIGLLLIGINANALVPLFWIIASAIGGVAGWEYFTGDISNTAKHTLNGIDSVAGDVFAGFYQRLDEWFKYTYTLLGNELKGIFWGLATLLFTLTFTLFLLGKPQWDKLGKLGLYVFIAAIFLQSTNEFYYWFVDPILNIQKGLIYLYLGVDSNILAKISGNQYEQTAFAIFGGVEVIFSKIFSAIGDIWDRINFSFSLKEEGQYKDAVAGLFAVLMLIFTYGFLYLVFSVLIFVAFFGLYVWLGVLPIVLLLGVINRQMIQQWIKQVLTYVFMPVFTAIVMSITLWILDSSLEGLLRLKDAASLYNADLAYAIFGGVLSIGMHWKAADFAAALAGGMQNAGAGSVAGAFGVTAGGAYAATRGIVGGGANVVSGFRGGNLGNKNSMLYQMSQEGREKLLKGGEDFK